MFHFHRWTVWEITESGEVIDRSGINKGKYYIQSRRCVKCGFIQHNREIV